MSIALPVRGAIPLALPRHAAPWCASALVLAWAVLMAGIHPAQFSDSIEQYNWAHSLEWGYWKHPPLPTWIMRAAIAVLGVSHWTAPLLAAACHIGTAWLMWSAARMLAGERVAQLTMVLWPLHHVLMGRAEVFNHNTVLILLATATVWAAVRAQKSGLLRDWLLFGAASGLGMLSKYQELVTIVGVVVAMLAAGSLRNRATQRGLAAAALVSLVVFMPHLMWAVAHDFPTMRYVEQSAPVLEPAARIPAVLRFFGMQLGLLVTMLVAAAAARFWPSRTERLQPASEPAASVAPWLFGLVGVPLIAVTITVVLGGHTPQKMWGLHTTLFVPLALAWATVRARAHAEPVVYASVAAALLVVANAAYAVVEAREVPNRPHAADRHVPASQLAQAALADWHAQTSCPLRFVRGGGFAAGLVSVYSGLYPAVLEQNFDKSPWIDPAELRASGSIELHGPKPAAEVPSNVQKMEVPAPKKFTGPAFIWWRIVPPQRRC